MHLFINADCLLHMHDNIRKYYISEVSAIIFKPCSGGKVLNNNIFHYALLANSSVIQYRKVLNTSTNTYKITNSSLDIYQGAALQSMAQSIPHISANIRQWLEELGYQRKLTGIWFSENIFNSELFKQFKLDLYYLNWTDLNILTLNSFEFIFGAKFTKQRLELPEDTVDKVCFIQKCMSNVV